MTSVDGLEYVGLEKGKKKFRARLVVTDAKTGRKHNTRVTILAESKSDAQAQRAVKLREYEARKLGHVSRPDRTRLAVVADAWLETLESHGTRISWSSHVTKIKAALGDQWLDTFDTDQLQRYLATIKGTRKDKLGAGTVNSLRDVIVKVFDYAKAQGLRSDNPARATTRMKTQKSRAERMAAIEAPKRRALTIDELVKFFAELRRLQHDTFPIVFVQYVLGCRFAEVSELRWRDIDLRTGGLVISRGQVRGRAGLTKNGEPRPAALGPVALELVKRHRLEMLTARWPGHEELVFPRRPETRGPKASGHQWSYSTVRIHILETFASLGITDMASVTHAARHTLNNVARRQADDLLLRKIIGHATADQSLAYTEAEMGEVIQFASRVELAMKLGVKP